MSACVLVSWAPEATEKSTRIPTPTNRLNSARGSHHTLPDRPRSTASRISRSLCKLRRIRPNQAGQPISGRALRLPDGRSMRLKVRSIVGLLPVCAVTVIEPAERERLPNLVRTFAERRGAAPLFLAPVLMLRLPESTVLRAAPPPPRGRVAALFRDGRARST